MGGVESLYTLLLILALVLNGVALTGSTPLREFFAPLRETRVVASAVGLDTFIVPVLVIGFATLLRVDDVTLAGLVIVAAASAGPIGIALARVARGDVALSVTLVTGIGLLNLITIPVISSLLLPETIPFPITPIMTSLVGLLLVPLLLGRLFNLALIRAATSDATRARLLGGIGGAASVSLLGAVSVAAFLEPSLVLAGLAGPITPIAIITMLAVAWLARAITQDPARRRTIAVVINARAVGLSLTLTALHFGDVPGLRAAVLTYGGLTQLVPIVVVLAARRRQASVAG
jgi:BASS family bile acid:Na+ symporter